MTALMLAGFGTIASAAEAQQADDHAQRPSVRALRVEQSIHVDGRLDEASWRSAPGATALTQREPVEGQPASEETEVWFAWDDEAIYVAARLHDRGGVSTRLGRRDSSLPGSDWFTVIFDTYHDHRSAFRFSVNPSGVRRDARISSGSEDESWDPVWDVATRTDEAGWTAELRIPLSQLRFRDDDEQTWGVQIERTISRTNEVAWFAFTPKRERSGVARYGHLTGMHGLRARGPLELAPYGLTRAQYRTVPPSDADGFANPFTDGSDLSASVGLDLKYRLASNLTLDATINPDFGQVEADPAEINLTAFETRFQEQRPFFIEGADIFRFGESTQLFYSRRIGAPPPGRLPADALYDDSPEQSTILGAAKLTGKPGDWSLGLLQAVTAREHAAYVTGDGTPGEVVVATPTSYFIGRARREFRDGESAVGGLVTALHRRMEDEAIAQRVRSSAYAGGIDFTHEWADRSWSLGGHVTAAHINGSTAAITAAQRSSTRYFQRPDAAHSRLDPAATSLSGWSGRMSLEKEAGEHWRGDASLSTTSPGYETNDLGFQSRADQHNVQVAIEYVQEQPGRLLREWAVDVSTGASWNYDGNRLSTSIGVEADVVLLNYWSADIELDRSFGGLDDRLTRGGPLARDPAATNFSVRIDSDSRRQWTLEVAAERERGAAISATGASVEIGLKPATSWNISLAPEWTRERSAAQFLTAVADTLARHTHQRRYVFADLIETEVSLAAHVNVTFTPNLTLEVFARPFFGSGHFGRPKELLATRVFRFASYDDIGSVDEDGDEFEVDPDGPGPAAPFDIEKEDFTVRSLRGNAVLRWEWRPGSTLFLVWQQEREREAAFSGLRVGRELRALGRIRPENVFMIKVSYWINP